MEVSRRDATEDWLLPERSRPPLISELEARVDEALATARSAEATAIAIGDAALDAAEQARRAAELAERASARFAGQPDPELPAADFEPIAPNEAHQPSPSTSLISSNGPKEGPSADERLDRFIVQADRLATRLQRLQRVPLSTPQ